MASRADAHAGRPSGRAASPDEDRCQPTVARRPPCGTGTAPTPSSCAAEDGRYVMYGTSPAAARRACLPDARQRRPRPLGGRRRGPRRAAGRRPRMPSTGPPRWPSPTAATGCTTPAASGMPDTRSGWPASDRATGPVRGHRRRAHRRPAVRHRPLALTATPPAAGGCSTPPTSSQGDRPGTVLAVQRLRDMTHLEGERTIVLRAVRRLAALRGDREIHGGVHDWHTLEGPAVLDDGAGGCVLLYSGGNWQTPGYGVAVGHRARPDRAVARGSRGRPAGHERQHRPRRTGALQRAHRRGRATTCSCTPGTRRTTAAAAPMLRLDGVDDSGALDRGAHRGTGGGLPDRGPDVITEARAPADAGSPQPRRHHRAPRRLRRRVGSDRLHLDVMAAFEEARRPRWRRDRPCGRSGGTSRCTPSSSAASSTW